MNAKLKALLIKTRRRLFGQNVGNNISAFRGNGIDFAELKEYSYGDDVRKINWKVTAREQKPYINVFNEERELNIVIAFLVSGSIYFGSRRQKQDVMAETLGLLSFAAVKNSDRVSAVFFDEQMRRHFKPTKSQKSLYAVLEYALGIDVLGKRADTQALADYLLKSVKERSIVVLIGDFYDMADLSYLGAKHETYAVVVRDPFEERPHLAGEYDLIDPATMRHYPVDMDESVGEAYMRALGRHDESLWDHFRKNRIAYTKIYTDEDPFVKLKEMLK